MHWHAFVVLIVIITAVFNALGTSPLAITGATLTLEWDPRLDDLQVTYRPAEECAQGCWRLVSARFEDVDESNGLHHIWARLLDADGQQVADRPWHVAWPDGDQRLMSKAAPDWADFAMYAGYDPANGPGPYRAYAGDDERRSDVVLGMGLPLNQHVSFRLVWQWTDSPSASPTPASGAPRVFLPIIVRQLPPTPTATPTSSPTPTPTPQYTGVLVGWEPNCAGTQVKGTVRDVDGTPLPGIAVRVLLFGIQHGDLLVTDTNGAYEFNRFGTSDPLLEIDYTVAVLDPATGTLLSNEVYVRTDRNECQPGGSGRQVATIDFTRRP
ncbi:MAG: carboxypeptidase-like regulatory domain-containing protein [Ardenticatenia bacterium]|nr:carboxypeptidase-like regulatory domain-containing protein [Ardenticatenia bacterium]